MRIVGEIGVARMGAAGLVPVDYAEIEAYGRLVGINMGRAAVTIRQISVAYAKGHNEAMSDEKIPAPWGRSREHAADALHDFLASL